MNEALVTLREAADEFNAGACELRTEALIRIGNAVTTWAVVIDGELGQYDNHGRLSYHLNLHRPDITLGEPQWEPDVFTGFGPCDVEVISQIFGIDLDARVWRKGYRNAKP
jgi:hypothetical protein